MMNCARSVTLIWGWLCQWRT